MNDIVYLGLSMLLVASGFAASYVLSSCFRVPVYISRKACHIISSLWVFIMVYKLESLWARAIGPALFIAVNIAIPKARLGLGSIKKDIGIAAFPASLLVISVLYSLSYIEGEVAVASVLVMGFGDSSAAIAGALSGSEGKSVNGSIAMTAVSFAVIALVLSLPWYLSLASAAVASLIERYTPSGYDNLTVPLIMAFILEVLCTL